MLFTQSREDAETARALKLIAGSHIEAIGNGVDPAAADGDERPRLIQDGASLVVALFEPEGFLYVRPERCAA